MLTVRVDDLGDRVGYVVQGPDGDMFTYDTREEADTAIRVADMDPGDVVRMGINMAMEYALDKHGDQPHGSVGIEAHLISVCAMVATFCDYPMGSEERLHVVCAAALHDVVEDTPVTIEDIRREFCDEIAELVEVLTDRPGENRYDRHLDTYWRIREKGSDAVLIKLADRAQNHSRSMEFNEHYQKMYFDEYPYFKMALWRPAEHVTMWAVLDMQYAEMKEWLNGEGLQEGVGVPQDAGTGQAKPGTEEGKVLGRKGRKGKRGRR